MSFLVVLYFYIQAASVHIRCCVYCWFYILDWTPYIHISLSSIISFLYDFYITFDGCFSVLDILHPLSIGIISIYTFTLLYKLILYIFTFYKMYLKTQTWRVVGGKKGRKKWHTKNGGWLEGNMGA